MYSYKLRLVFLIIISFIFTIAYHRRPFDSFRNHPSIRTPSPPTPSDRHQPQTNVTMLTDIFYFKTHKTASSTVQNILMRFGLRHSLNFALPTPRNRLKTTTSPESALEPGTLTKTAKYNILTHHCVEPYNASLKHVYLRPDAVTVTILRDPADVFESSFVYYRLQRKFRQTFRQFTRRLNNDAGTISQYSRTNGRNTMSKDLGLPVKSFDNATAIEAFVGRIDTEFDLVMIAEHMEISLVLLARLMRWPLKYVAFLNINVRPYDKKYQLSRNDRINLRKFNNADQTLYRHFVEKFKNRVRRYGLKEVLRDASELVRINRQLRRKCVSEETRKGYANTVAYKLKNVTDFECVYATKTELQFTEILKKFQIRRLRRKIRVKDLP